MAEPVPRFPGLTLPAVLAVLLLAVTLAPGPARAQASEDPGAAGLETIARVNGQPILRRDYDLAVQLRFRRRGPGRRGIDDLRAVRESVVQTLIDNELIYQSVKGARIEIPESEVDEELDRLRRSHNPPGALDGLLEQNRITESEFREQVRRTLLVMRYIDQEVVGELSVQDADVRRYYEEHPEEMEQPEGVRISQIVAHASLEAAASVRNAAREKIEAIARELQSGTDFAELARLHSDGPEAERGGDSGYVTRGGRALPRVEETAFALRTDEVSDIIETRRGYHIIKVTARRPSGRISPAEATEAIRERLLSRARSERIDQYIAGLRKMGRIERADADAPS